MASDGQWVWPVSEDRWVWPVSEDRWVWPVGVEGVAIECELMGVANE